MRRDSFRYAVTAALASYLLLNTGFVSDDFVDILKLRDLPIPVLLKPSGNFINVPVGHLTHHIWFALFSIENSYLVDLFKITFVLISLVLLTEFFKSFAPPGEALLISILFTFFPSHDSIPYWYAPTGHLLSLSLYFYAYRLAEQERLATAFLLGFLASFMVYGSTPTAVALFALCWLKKRVRAGLVLLAPNIIYAIYFVQVSLIARVAPSRVLEPVSASSILKQFLLQGFTFADATLGPSMWLKIYYAVFQLSIPSCLLAVSLIYLSYTAAGKRPANYDRHLLLALITLAVSSFLMFAVTGRYPQLAFNLGNRTTFWGSLLLAYIIVLLPAGKIARTTIAALMIVSVFGISDHWKSWNLHQNAIIRRIQENQQLSALKAGSTVLVSGNQYSKYGPLSHIEFLSEDWVPRAIFNLTLERPLNAHSLNHRIRYKDGYLLNKKTGRVWPVEPTVLVYDSRNDNLLRIPSDRLNQYIDSLPVEKRHWLMLDDNRLIHLIRTATIRLMPRMKGRFETS